MTRRLGVSLSCFSAAARALLRRSRSTAAVLVLYAASVSLALVALGAACGTVRAQEPKRVVVLTFHGRSAALVRTQVVNALRAQSELALVSSARFEGLTGSALRDAAAKAGVSALVQGKVAKKGKLLAVSVSVRAAETGEVVHEERWTKPKRKLADIESDFWSRMGPHILAIEAPEQKRGVESVIEAEPEPPPVARAEPEPEREPVPPPPAPLVAAEPTSSAARVVDDAPAHPALVLMAGTRLLWRSLSYEGDTTLSGYSSYSGTATTGPAFTLAANALWFPGAHFSRAWPSDIGLELDADYSFLKSTQAGKELKTNAYELAGALMFRLPFESFEPRFRLGYVQQTFDVGASSATQLPGVKYGSLRIAAGTLIHIVRAFNLEIGGGYLVVLSTGEFGKKRYADDLSAYGWEVNGGATYRIKDAYGIRLGAEFRRYALDMGKSENDQILLPKGGHDDFLRLTLSFVYALEGK